jgi:GTP 3',8-cyclase
MTGLSDSFQRPINYLRVSVTDRCNLRCIYCMPSQGVGLMSHGDILSYEEIHSVVRAAADLGVNKIRLTGGEPLVRAGLTGLIELIARTKGIDDIALTTNGILLARDAVALKQAGLCRVNVSLDTLRPERFRQITRLGESPDQVLSGIEAARKAGLDPVKINMVVVAGVNDDEIVDFATRTINEEWNVRFIEMMPLVGSNTPFIPASEMRRRLEQLGLLEPCLPTSGNGPAKYYRLPHAKGTIGFITPVSEHFCFQCNRMRLTADGKLRPCLLSDFEIDVKESLRQGISPEGLKEVFKKAVASKPLRHQLDKGQVPNGRPFSQVGG